MEMRFVGRLVLAAVLGLAITPAMAAGDDAAKTDAGRITDFPAYRSATEKELAGGDKYKEITPESRNRALMLLAQMDELIGRTGNVDSLLPTHQLEVFNRQEELNQILTLAAEDSRLICRRERPTGSKLPVNNCLTVAERRRTREGGRDYLREVIPAQEPVTAR
jgi:hypothetical protein